MSPPSIPEILRQRPLVCDGATGTQLQSLGLKPGACGELWNVESPDHVRLVHRRYLEAGADLLTTNTFGGTPLALANHGLESRTEELNRAAARLAREVAGDAAWVLGDMGPFGGLMEPYGDIDPELVREAFARQAGALLEGGADALLVETMSDPAEASLAIAAACAAGAQVVIATFAFQKTPDGFRTMMGHDVAAAIRSAIESGAGIVGANCGTELSLEDYLSLTTAILRVAEGRPVIVQPNAGSPVMEQGGVVYRTGPEAFAGAALGYLKAGARIVGGCCGSGPAHTEAVARAVKGVDAGA